MHRPASSYRPRHPAHAWALSQAWAAAHQPAGEHGKDWMAEEEARPDDASKRAARQADPRRHAHALFRHVYYARPVGEACAYGPGLRCLSQTQATPRTVRPRTRLQQGP